MKIKLNLEEIEMMLYFWKATNDREKVAEQYLTEVAAMPGLKASYGEDFNEESVRKVLSAITNREILSTKTKTEGKFWNNNMWMMEDLEYTDMMVQPLKKLNLDSLENEIVGENSIEIVFSPLPVEEYIIKGNTLIVNFFRVKPSDFDDSATVDNIELKEYIKNKIMEKINK